MPRAPRRGRPWRARPGSRGAQRRPRLDPERAGRAPPEEQPRRRSTSSPGYPPPHSESAHSSCAPRSRSRKERRSRTLNVGRAGGASTPGDQRPERQVTGRRPQPGGVSPSGATERRASVGEANGFLLRGTNPASPGSDASRADQGLDHDALVRAHDFEQARSLERWMVQGFWYLSDWLPSWTGHPNFPRPGQARVCRYRAVGRFHRGSAHAASCCP